MQVIEVRNVHDALLRGLELLEVHGITRDSRNGPVRESECPVTTVYHRPQERVLFWEQRDGNPFFHFMEIPLVQMFRDKQELVIWKYLEEVG